MGGFLAALETEAGVGEVINIGSGFEISIGDTARLIAELMDAEIEIEHDDVRASAGAQRSRAAVGQQRQGAKAARAGRRASAGVDGLRKGLEQTIAWFTKNENLSRYRANAYNL